MKLKRVVAWGLALTMAMCLDIPGVNAANGGFEASSAAISDDDRAAQIALAKGDENTPGQLPGVDRTFFDENSDIRDWFNISGYVADGVQDRSEYYEEYVANGKKNTANYKVVEEDGYWHKTKKDADYITTEAYNGLDEAEKENYRYVTAEEQFTAAVSAKPRVIQVNAEELELGFHYLEDNKIPKGPVSMVSDYDSGSKQFPPITNPVIMHGDDKYLTDGVKAQIEDSKIRGTGVSEISLYSNLTMFSTTGCMLHHVGFDINGCEDIILRNFQFEGMYEWDDQTEEICEGKDFTTRKRYGWGYFSVKQSRNVWVDHCTFGFAFDGNDLSNGSSCSITWCKFGVQNILDGKDENTHETPVSITMEGSTPVYSGTRWFESEGSELWKNILFMEEVYQKYKAGLLSENQQYHYYTKYRDKGATPQELLRYGAMHSKVHLVGTGEKEFYTNVDEKITLGFNYYTNVIQRLPMVRSGNGHMYNCIVDNEEYQTNSKQLTAKGVPVGYTSYNSVNNARNGATIGTDTCIFNDVTPNCGVETQGQDTGNITDEGWASIVSNMVNHNLTVNSKVTIDGASYTGSSWDNNGENLFNRRWTWNDKSSIGDFKWSKWEGLEVFRNAGSIDTNAISSIILGYAEKNGASALYNNYYKGQYDLEYSYKCFELDEVESKLETYGGAMEQLYGSEETMLDYIQPYNSKSAQDEYKKKVTLNVGGATVENLVNSTFYLKDGETLTLPTEEEMLKTGYTFAGWKKGSYKDGQLEYSDFLEAGEDGKFVIDTSNTDYEEEVYYAIWDVISYTITFDSMGGDEIAPITVNYNQTISFPQEPTKEDATFVGWYKYTPETQTYGSKILSSQKVTADMELYAKWSNTITFDTDGGTEIESKMVNSGDKIKNVSAPEKKGYTFIGWFTDKEFTNAFDIANDKVMEPMTLYAKFRSDGQTTVTISFETGYETVTIPAIEVEIGATGSAISAIKTPVVTDAAVAFDGWYTDRECTKAFDPEAEINDDMILYAKWKKTTVTVSFETGYETATIPAIEVEVGATGSAILAVEVPSVTDAAVEFDGWYTDRDCTEAFDPEAKINNDMILYAKWKSKRVLGDINGSGSLDVADALAVLKHIVGEYLDDSLIEIADINKSGSPDIGDALAILKYVAKGEW